MPTTARGIWTPSDTDAVDFTTHLATMAGTIDTALTNLQNAVGAGANAYRGTAAQRAAFLATAVVGQLWQDTDSIMMLWKKVGAAWVSAVWRWQGTTAQMNAFTVAPNGFSWFNTTDNSEYVRISGAWSMWSRGKTTYTPTLTNVTLGAGGVASGEYTVSEGFCNVRAWFRLGTSGFSWGDANIGLPLTRVDNAVPDITLVAGSATFTDSSAGAGGRYAGGAVIGSGSAVRLGAQSTSGLLVFGAPPFTPAANDAAMVLVTYPVA